MAKPKSYTTKQVILKLCEAEVLPNQGQTVKHICRVLEVSEQTYCRWRREYNTVKPQGGVVVDVVAEGVGGSAQDKLR